MVSFCGRYGDNFTSSTMFLRRLCSAEMEPINPFRLRLPRAPGRRLHPQKGPAFADSEAVSLAKELGGSFRATT